MQHAALLGLQGCPDKSGTQDIEAESTLGNLSIEGCSAHAHQCQTALMC